MEPPANPGRFNFRSIENAGFMVNSGALSNYATFTNGQPTQYAQVDNDGTLSNFGTLTNDSTLINRGLLINEGNIEGSGYFHQYTGQTIVNGSMNQPLIIIDGGTVQGTGSVTFDHLKLGAGATFAPGNSIGTLTLNGDFSSSGKLVLEIAGLSFGEYDVLEIHGNALFTGGTVRFDFLGDAAISAGDSWDFQNFVLADSLSGWETLDFAVEGLDGGLDWQIEGGALVITQIPEPATALFLGLGLLRLAARRKS